MPEVIPTTRSTHEVVEKFLTTARKRFELAWDHDKDERDLAYSDLTFYDGEHWPPELKQKREDEGRPCLVIDKLQEKVDQVVGDQRQNRPSIQVIAVDDVADPQTAETMEGLIRHVEYNNDADEVYDNAFEPMVICGRGWIRIRTQYASDDAFDQDIIMEDIANPLSVYWDPNTKKRNLADARFAFVCDTLTPAAFDERYPNKRHADFSQSDQGDINLWKVADMVRIAQYIIRYPVKGTLYLLADEEGQEWMERHPVRASFEIPPGTQVLRQRPVDMFQVASYIISGVDILSGPHFWPGRYIPLVPLWGKETNVGGKRKVRGLIRRAKDAQRMFNYWESTATEVIALSPKVPWILTAEQIKGHEKEWKKVHEASLPYLVYNQDEKAPPPKRIPGAAVPTGIEHRAAVNSEHIKSTTGLYDPSLGARSNETSGRAILLRQREGDTATYAFIDNLARAQRHIGRILIDLIPYIYDAARIVRIRGKDGTEQQVPINAEDGEGNAINDLTTGKYDIRVESGPSFSTQRQEAVEAMLRITQSNSDIFMLIGDLLVKNMDWPGAQEMADRLRPIAEAYMKRMTAPPEEEGQQPDPVQEMKLEEMALKTKKAEIDMMKSASDAGVPISPEMNR